MNKKELIQVFENTKKLVDSNTYEIKSSSSKYSLKELSDIQIKDSIAVVKTINSDTVSAAEEYSKLGKTCILNMASSKNPGGGVINGAKAQEECLFRCSDLFKTVAKDFYPIKHDEAIYTKDALFFKDKNYELSSHFYVDVITIPALNLNSNAKYDNLDIINEYDNIMKNKIRLMLYLAQKNDCENIILGAWGCGVFNNNPVDVAKLFEEIIFEKENSVTPSYFNSFKNIIFAVINDHNSVDDNYSVFSNYFGN